MKGGKGVLRFYKSSNWKKIKKILSFDKLNPILPILGAKTNYSLCALNWNAIIQVTYKIQTTFIFLFCTMMSNTNKPSIRLIIIRRKFSVCCFIQKCTLFLFVSPYLNSYKLKPPQNFSRVYVPYFSGKPAFKCHLWLLKGQSYEIFDL